MQFETIKKSEIKSGYCLLVSSSSFLSKMIQKFQRMDCEIGGKFNHSGIFVSFFDELFIFEADYPVNRFYKFQNYIDRKNTTLLVGIPSFEIDYEELVKLCLYYSDVRYDYFNLLLHQAVRFLTNKKVWIGRKPEKAKKSFICGELTAYLYYCLSDYNLFENWHKIAPVDIFKNPFFTWKLFQKD